MSCEGPGQAYFSGVGGRYYSPPLLTGPHRRAGGVTSLSPSSPMAPCPGGPFFGWHREDTECLAWGRIWAGVGLLSGSKGGSCLGCRTQGRPEGGGWEQGWRVVLCGADLTAALRQENVTEKADASSLHSPDWKSLSYCWRPQACLFPCGLCSHTSPCSLSPWLWEHSDGHSQDPCLRALAIAVNPVTMKTSHPWKVSTIGADSQVDVAAPESLP